jgi:radical SAM protein with 4Fe4S-binding SPASM domain
MNLIDKKVEALEAFIERKERLKQNTPLRYLFWESTLRCSLQCLHCGSDCVRDDSTQNAEIDAESVKRELRSISERYSPAEITFAIIGGEPLIRGDTIEVGAYAASLGYNWGITTNGMMLKEDVIRSLEQAGLKTISVSLDGIAADHDALRDCPGSYEIVTRAIERLLAKPFYEKFDVICCVSKINVDHLDQFMAEVIRLGVPAVRFAPVFSRGRAAENSQLALDREDYLTLLNFVKQQRQVQNAVRVNLSEEGYWGPEWECEVRDRFHYCASGITVGTILHDGSVTGCPSVSRKFIEGNIKDARFVDIWQSSFTRYRQDRKKTFSQTCGDCEHWVLCEGGGFHLLDQPGDSVTACSLERIGARESHE